MILQVFTLSEEYKNLFRKQKQFVKLIIDSIASYLVQNGDATEQWRKALQQDDRLTYYDVIPQGHRLKSQEISLELFVTNAQGLTELKIFKKDTSKAHLSMIGIVNKKLLKRKEKLITMLNKTTIEEEMTLFNNHIQYTQNLINECTFIKISSQLLIGEVGALHFINTISTAIENAINQSAHIDYLKFKQQIAALKKVIMQYSLPLDGAREFTFSEADILKTRQKFNSIYNQIHNLCLSMAKEGLLNPADEKQAELSLEEQFRYLQQLFFAKNDVDYTIVH